MCVLWFVHRLWACTSSSVCAFSLQGTSNEHRNGRRKLRWYLPRAWSDDGAGVTHGNGDGVGVLSYPLPQKQDKQRKPLKRPWWTSTRWNILRYQLYRQWETRFLLCSQVWHSLIFCQSRFSEQRTKTRSRAVWSCFYHEVSQMWVMWNPTICIHVVSRPETGMITVGADIDECFIFFKII